MPQFFLSFVSRKKIIKTLKFWPFFTFLGFSERKEVFVYKTLIKQIRNEATHPKLLRLPRLKCFAPSCCCVCVCRIEVFKRAHSFFSALYFLWLLECFAPLNSCQLTLWVHASAYMHADPCSHGVSVSTVSWYQKRPDPTKYFLSRFNLEICVAKKFKRGFLVKICGV